MHRFITASFMALILAFPLFFAEAASQSVRVKSSSHTSVTSDGNDVHTESHTEESTTENGETQSYRHVFSCVGKEHEDRAECMEEVEWNDDGERGSASRRIQAADSARLTTSDTWLNLPSNVQAFIRNHLSARFSTSVLSDADEDEDTSRMSMKERSQMRREMRRVSWELCSTSFAEGGRNCLQGSVEESN